MKNTEVGVKLTLTQQKAYGYIVKGIDLGKPPTFREIQNYMGYSATMSAQNLVNSLIVKGLLDKEDHVMRGLRRSDVK